MVSWCNKREVCPTKSGICYVLDFLAELSESGLQYRTIGSHRSTMSVFHDLIGGINVENHPRVLVLMAGMFNQKPPQRRHILICNVESVLNYLWVLPENNLLSDKLLALTA